MFGTWDRPRDRRRALLPSEGPGLRARLAIIGSLWLACMPAADAAADANAHADELPHYTLDIDFAWADYGGCGDGSVVADAACGDLVENAPADPTGPRIASIVLGGVRDRQADGAYGLGAIQFGLRYDVSLGSAAWTLCTGGAEAPDLDWPHSGTGNRVVMTGGCLDGTEHGLVRLGFLTLGQDASGVLNVVGDPRDGDRAWVWDCSAMPADICKNLLGWGDVTAGGTSGNSVCGERCELVGVPPEVTTSWGTIKSLYRK